MGPIVTIWVEHPALTLIMLSPCQSGHFLVTREPSGGTRHILASEILEELTIHPTLPFRRAVNYRDPGTPRVTRGDDVTVVDFVQLPILYPRARPDGEEPVAFRVDARDSAAGAPGRLTITTLIGEGNIQRPRR
ncbi:hypothetical protein FHS21_005713 [Phyllobacterium trifolii]|uniref:Uncharacterized protein n=1 Tax=Phyllobacterium trifolii TaxID=300193 RepID=A0A839UKW2_9HYPH|nr:hypothetical protein [Phyllobacterium trifolii]